MHVTLEHPEQTRVVSLPPVQANDGHFDDHDFRPGFSPSGSSNQSGADQLPGGSPTAQATGKAGGWGNRL